MKYLIVNYISQYCCTQNEEPDQELLRSVYAGEYDLLIYEDDEFKGAFVKMRQTEYFIDSWGVSNE